MRTNGLILLIAGALMVITCGQRERDAETIAAAAEDRERRVLLQRDEKQFRDALATFRESVAHATSITVYRIANPFDDDYEQIAAATKLEVARYPVRAQVGVTKERIRPLAGLLTARDTYFPAGETLTCLFEPHHIVEVHSTAGTMRAVICVQCGDVELIPPTGSIGTHSVRPGPNDQISRLLEALTIRP